MPLPEYRQSPAHIYVPTFTLHEDHLAVITTLADEGHSLPNMYVQRHHLGHADPVQAAAREALYSTFGEAQPTLEPFTTYIKTETRNTDIEVGFAAIARLVDILANPRLAPIPLPHIEDSSVGLTCVAVDFIKAGLEKLREYSNLPWSAGLKHPNTLPKLSRLVKNPRRFTLAELRIAYEALLQASVDSSNRSQTPRKQLDSQNFQREIRNTTIVPLSEHRMGAGRPAQLWTMPPTILTPGPTGQ